MYKCSICGALVKVSGDTKEYTCEHVGAPIVADLSSTCKGKGALNKK